MDVVLAIRIMPLLKWRWLLGISSAPLLIFICLCIWVPESARFQLICNKPDLALKTLKRIANANKKDSPDWNLEIKVILF